MNNLNKKNRTRFQIRKRLVETNQKLNKTMLSEKYDIDEREYTTLISALDALEKGDLLNERGGDYEATSQQKDDNLYVDITGNDRAGNEFSFNFEIIYEDTLDDDVYNIETINILEFYTKDKETQDEFRLYEDNLKQFNEQYDDDLYTTISKYIDIDFESEEVETEEMDESVDAPEEERVADYLEMVYVQGDHADNYLDIIETQGPDKAIPILLKIRDIDMGGSVKSKDKIPTQEYDYHKNNYRLFWNPYIGYVGVDYIL